MYAHTVFYCFKNHFVCLANIYVIQGICPIFQMVNIILFLSKFGIQVKGKNSEKLIVSQ